MAALPRRSRRPVQATLIGLARLAPLSVVLASPVPSSQHTLLDDEEWALVVPFAPVRGKPLARSPALGTLHQCGHLVSTSEAIELNERYVAGAQLLAVWPEFMHHVIVGLQLSRAEFNELSASKPQRVEGLFRAHFG